MIVRRTVFGVMLKTLRKEEIETSRVANLTVK